jgi:2-methylcitrate dehydratase PrpD
MGAAVAYAVAAGVDRAATVEAVGNSYVFAAGNKQAVLDSSLMKRVMPGFAARNGVLGARTAAYGLGGVTNWLSGQYGLYELYYEGDMKAEAIEGGDRLRIQELSIKPYPACRFTHGAIEAATRIRERSGSAVPTDGDIHVRYPALDRFGIVSRPFERRGSEEMDAQFSTPYLVAEALVNGEVTFASYAPARLDDPAVAELARRVSVVCDLPPGHDSDIGPIELRVGDQVERIDAVLGSPARPLGAPQMAQKYAVCRAHNAERTGQQPPTYAAFRDAVAGFGDGAPVADVLAALMSPTTPTEQM